VSDERINIHPNTPPVRGYRDLTQAEVDLINQQIKAKGDELAELIAAVRAIQEHDEHCANLAEDQLRIGTMLLVRAVARPTGF
jgi:hypothetical protein